MGTAAEPRPLRLLFLAPFPPRADAPLGSARALAGLLAHLAPRHRLAVVYLRRPGDLPPGPEVAERCERLEEVALPSTANGRIGRRIRLLGGLLGGRPMNVTRWAAPAFAERARSLCLSWHPDVVQADLAVMGPYLAALEGRPVPRVLVEHEPAVTGAEGEVRRSAGLLRAVRRLDLRAWRRLEPRLLRGADAVVAFTGRDAEVLRRLAPGVRVERIPLGIPLPEKPLDPRGTDPPSILFLGNYTHSPNVDAAVRLATSIFPAVERRCPGARLVLAGDAPPAEVRRLARPGIEVTGRVPDAAPCLDRAAVVAAPLRLGGGMRVKVLEALAAGKAVVASPLAVEGLDLPQGADAPVVVAESDEGFAMAVAGLLDSPERRAALAGRARGWACAHLGWERPAAAFERLYEELLATGGAA